MAPHAHSLPLHLACPPPPSCHLLYVPNLAWPPSTSPLVCSHQAASACNNSPGRQCTRESGHWVPGRGVIKWRVGVLKLLLLLLLLLSASRRADGGSRQIPNKKEEAQAKNTQAKESTGGVARRGAGPPRAGQALRASAAACWLPGRPRTRKRPRAPDPRQGCCSSGCASRFGCGVGQGEAGERRKGPATAAAGHAGQQQQDTD